MRSLVVVFYALTYVTATAQGYQVRSGEHANFSRLVILYPETPEWEYGRVEGGYELRTSDVVAEYDLESVFDLIPRDRISSVEVRKDSHLFISVPCNCHSDVFEIRQGLVIDIKDGSPSAFSRFENKFPETISVTQNDNRTPGTSMQNEIQSEKNMKLSSERLPNYVFGRYNELESLEEFENQNNNPYGKLFLNNNMSKIQISVVNQIGAAATQGLINPSITKVVKGQNSIENTLVVGEGVAPQEKFPNSSTNMRVETAVERGRYSGDKNIDISIGESTCEDSNLFDVSSWGDLSLRQNEISFSRTGLYNDIDLVDQNTVRNLAKSYLFYSFGAEALALIDQFFADEKRFADLRMLAEIMKGNKVKENEEFRNQIYCKSKSALWSAISYPFDMKSYNIVEKDNIISHFSSLPRHLRKQFGLTLSNRFLDMRDIESARKVRNSISRVLEDKSDVLLIIDANISLKVGDIVSEIEELQKLALSERLLAPEAMLSLLEILILQDEMISQDLLDKLASLVELSVGSDTGSKLRITQIYALITAGKIYQATENLKNFLNDGEIENSARHDVAVEIVRDLLDKFEEIEFVNFILNFDIAKNLHDRDVLQLAAQKLINLGFPELAKNILNSISNSSDSKYKVLMASLYIQEGRGDLALGYLAGLTGNQASLIRAKALELVGNYSEASNTIKDLDEKEILRRLALQSRDWETLAKIGASTQVDAASLLIEKDKYVDASNSSPKNDRNLISNSQESRRILGNLLAVD